MSGLNYVEVESVTMIWILVVYVALARLGLINSSSHQEPYILQSAGAVQGGPLVGIPERAFIQHSVCCINKQHGLFSPEKKTLSPVLRAGLHW